MQTYSYQQAATLKGVSVRTIYYAIARGELVIVRLTAGGRRITKASLMSWGGMRPRGGNKRKPRPSPPAEASQASA